MVRARARIERSSTIHAPLLGPRRSILRLLEALHRFEYDPNEVRLSRILVDPLVADSVNDAAGNAPDPAMAEQPITTASVTSTTATAAAAASLTAAPTPPVEQPPRRRDRLMSMRSRQRAMRWHYTSLAAAFATSIFVAGLLVAACWLNSEALWEALA